VAIKSGDRIVAIDMNTPLQMTLPVSIRDDARFANYYAGPNQQVIDALQGQWTVKGEPYIYLCGTRGVGTSHLLQAACHYAEGLGHQSIYLPLNELKDYGPDVLEGVEKLPLVAIDGVDAVVGDDAWEIALFHLFNRVRDRQGHLLLGANDSLILRARQRGFDLLDEVASFILTRGPRDMAGLSGVLDRLDQASLTAKRKLTIPFVKAEMGW
jgi:DnaA family protein